MKNLFKTLSTFVLIGAAWKAGETLVDDVLKYKTKDIADKIKKKIKEES
jgi:hypothetical protein